MSCIAIVGGGASGLMAAIAAAQNGVRTVVYERNRAPGRKLLLTGKGRCNVTNIAQGDAFLQNIKRNPVNAQDFITSDIHLNDSANRRIIQKLIEPVIPVALRLHLLQRTLSFRGIHKGALNQRLSVRRDDYLRHSRYPAYTVMLCINPVFKFNALPFFFQ